MGEPRSKSVREYHVFLASPADMEAERQEVRRFFDEYNRTTAKPVWNVQFTVIDWENYATAGAGRPQELITSQTLERFRDSLALVIGLMGQRFGSPTGTHESGTEEEFEWALEQHRTTGFPEIKWFFRKIDKFVAPRDLDEINKATEQWEKVCKFREKVQQPGPYQLYYKEFTDGDDFRHVLGKDLSVWLTAPGRPWIARDREPQVPDVRPLHQLPPPPGDFVGRRQELGKLTERIESGGAAISGVRGMGGIGKTALALKLAEQLTSRYPDAQFYLNLKGAHQDKQPLTVAEALSHVIRAYHPIAKLPDNEEELRGMYQSVLHGKQALLLMDNARDADQVAPLIPPAGCVLLVTSRVRFTLPKLHALDLDALPPKDARALLCEIAPRLTKGQANVIAKRCGRLPLALRLAGKALAEHADLNPDDYARRLADARQRLEFIDASLSLSYDLLDEEPRALWAKLSVFPDTFDRHAAAAVWDVPPDPAAKALSDLVRHSMVEWDDATKRYRLHDLARVFADARLDPPNRTPAQRRHAVYYETVLRAARELYMQGGESIQRGLGLFDLEWPNIQTGQAWAEAHSAAADAAARLCSDYPDAGVYCLNVRQQPRTAIRWLEAASAAARRLKYRAAEAVHVGNLGNAYEALGEPRRAVKLHKQALAILREIGDRHGEASALGGLGNAYVDLGDPRRAIKPYEQRLDIARSIGDRWAEGAVLGNLGNAYAALGETRPAIKFYEQALPIHREIGDRLGEANTVGNLGTAYADLGDPARAVKFYEQQFEIAREIGDRRGQANACWNLGRQYAKQGDLGRAIELMQVCVDYEREIGHADAEKHAAEVEALRARLDEQA